MLDSSIPPRGSPVLEMSGIGKRFPGVRALHDVRFRLFAGEVHALMGQNGAGKSTLIKVLTGVHRADEGHITLDGRPVAPASPQEALQLGISTVYQEVNLCPNLSVAENLFIGRFPGRSGRIDWDAVNAGAEHALAALHLHIDVTRRLAAYPVAIQQMVAIARAMTTEARILVLDEPTSSLDEDEVEQLFAAIRSMRARGVAILFVTHFLDQVYAIADRITVLRNGEHEGEYLPPDLPRLTLISKMIGRDYAEAAAPRAPACNTGDAAPVLSARALGRRGAIQAFDLDLRAGEVMGLAGLLGSGRTEMARLLFGIDRADRGDISVTQDGRPFRSPRDAIRHGIGFCPEDRKTEGIVAELSVRENIVLALQARRGWRRFLSMRRQRAIADAYIRMLGIRTPDAEEPIGQLSGGNQQKALLARWLATEPKMLILDEPTRGIDVGAKQEIMAHVLALCQQGMAILFISSEIDETLRVSHRVAILRDRSKVAELPAAQLDEDAVMHIIAGGQP